MHTPGSPCTSSSTHAEDVEEEEEEEEEGENESTVNKTVRYFDVYGPQACPEVIFPPAAKETKLTLEDIQGLVRWILADGTNPNWVFIKNKPLISKLVILYIPGLDAATYMSHAKLLQNLTNCCGKPRALVASSSIMDPIQMLDAFFTIKCKKRKLTEEPSHGTVPFKPVNGMPQEACERSLANKEIENHGDCDVPRKSAHGGDFLYKSTTATGLFGRDESVSSYKEFEKQFPPSYYTLTEAEMQEHKYPVCADTDGYVQTQPLNDHLHMVALDCEMCYTKDGLELTRASLVDRQGKVLFDSLVKPSNPIVDYNTKYSGITQEMMVNVTTTLKDVQEEILKIIAADTILVGHSLENDLAALKLVHGRIIDTALMYRNPRGLLFKPALRILALQFLRRKIQHGNGGHDSIEDARAAMDLVLQKIKNGPGFGKHATSVKENLLSVLSKHGNQCTVIDRRPMLQRYAAGPSHSIPCTTDEEALLKAKKEVRNKQRNFVWVQFSDLQSLYEEQAKGLETLTAHAAQVAALMTCNTAVETANVKRNSTKELKNALIRLSDCITQLHSALPPRSMFIVASGHGDIATVRRLRQLTRDKLLDKEETTQKSWASILGDIQAEAETAVAFVCVKS